MTAYERTGEDWKVVLGPTPADLGELGLGAPQDDVFRTPVGTPLTPRMPRTPAGHRASSCT
ncbi:hypothetical protein [Mycolicibacterium sp. P9-64]|uniref:hypothetical protein n=1 Tax=Mycolicibacterium sp. P9-64 TaxID=2024612 RepID=UPI001F5B8A70|nr:hypothetical protein [Mycolicibacterium sp. P9-64]